MNILFITVSKINNIDQSGIYTDLLREFVAENHDVTVITPIQRREKIGKTIVEQVDGVTLIKVKTGNFQKTNPIEKTISQSMIEKHYINAIKRYTKNKKFDLVLYATPPITFEKVVSFVKKRDNAKAYLLLKDIFPQNAVDLQMIRNKSLVHQFFRNKEKKLYQISDHIGCMSQGNLDYLINHNPEIKNSKVEINPNTIEIREIAINKKEREKRKEELNINKESIVFMFGGNLGKPQGIDFLIEYLKQEQIEDTFFIIAGNGTERYKLEKFFLDNQPSNAILLDQLPKEEYEKIEQIADVGLVFLDKRFTIPNIPSRILGYMNSKIPILAATDKHTDLRDIIMNGQLGFWSEHGDIKSFRNNIIQLLDKQERRILGENAYMYLKENYEVKKTYNTIMQHFRGEE